MTDASGASDALDPEILSARIGELPTPGAILTRMRNVDADVRALDAEIRAHREQLTTAFERGWAHWRDAWRRFFNDNQGFAARAWPGTLGEVEAFARRLRDWRAAAERAGVDLSTPAPGRAQPRRPVVQLPNLPEFPSLRDVGPALREIAPVLRDIVPSLPVIPPMLGADGPLSAQFWESVKPVAIASAVAVGGLAIVWLFINLRTITGQAKDLESIAPLLLSKGIVP
jgi:hypothetical protein